MIVWVKEENHKCWLAAGFAALGGYVLLGWYFAHVQRVVIDEGAYLYKGWLFIHGVYRPFQPYGPWTNKMPLSFLIYGAVQYLFGPGLATGRYFSLAASVAALVGMGMLLARLTNRRMAAIALWASTATVALARVYSLSVSESIGACLIIWSLFFLVRAAPRPWHLFVGGLLAGALSVTRINLTLVWVFALLFPWWAYGWRKARWAWLGALLVPAIVYAAYWPNIMFLWTRWLPHSLQTLFPWAGLDFGKRVITNYIPSPTVQTQIQALAEVLSIYAVFWAALGALTAGLLHAAANRKAAAADTFRWRAAVGMAALAWGLLLLHLWATIGKRDVLFYNLPAYFGFFAPLMLAAFGLAFKTTALHEHNHPLLAGAVWFSALVPMAAGVFLHHKLVRCLYYQALLTLHLGFLHKEILLALAGFLAALWLWRGAPGKARLAHFLASPRQATVASLAVLTLLSPTMLFSASFKPYDCYTPPPEHKTLSNCLAEFLSLADYRHADLNAPQRQAEIGARLSAVFHPNAKVYWEGPEAVTPLLYIPYPVETFPAQYNASFNRHQGGSADALERFGYWNETLAARWLQEANFIVTSQETLEGDPAKEDAARRLQFLKNQQPLLDAPSLDVCDDANATLIFTHPRAP